MSKGSKQRPRQVSFDEFADNWDKVFKQEEHGPESAEVIQLPLPFPFAVHDPHTCKWCGGRREKASDHCSWCHAYMNLPC